jgi:tol-pal system protein YbgF
MRGNGRLAIGLTLAALACVATPGYVAAESTAERLDRLERQLDSRGLLDMLTRLDQLQRDLQELRGELELQAHRQEDMTRRQRELESGQVAASTATPTLEAGQAADPVIMPPAGQAGEVAAPQVDAGAPATSYPGEQAAYEQALGILREGRYADAAAAFNRQLASFPGGEYADNSTYWLGETYYVTRDFDRALSTFSSLVNEFPQSPKLPDARLKIGYIHYENGSWKEARQTLSEVVSNHPGTTAARLANDRLQRMQKEGH